MRAGEPKHAPPSALLFYEDAQASGGIVIAEGIVVPPESRCQKATKAPGLVGVIRAVRICHISSPSWATPDS